MGADAFVGENLEQDRVGFPAVGDGGTPDAALHGLEAGRHFGNHSARQARYQFLEFFGANLSDDIAAVRPIGIETLDIGEDEQFLRIECCCQSGSSRVRVDVVNLPRFVWGDG